MLYDPFIRPIEEFAGQYRFLSNFYLVPIAMDDEIGPSMYPSVEHAYQAAKTFDVAAREQILKCAKPGDAKRIGRHVALRDDWEKVKLKIMYWLVYQKFDGHLDLHDKLMATGAARLIEGNYWGDTFWGVCGGMGQNHLGKILMQVRQELRPK